MRSLIAVFLVFIAGISRGAEVGGPVITNTLWSTTGAPYLVTNDIVVARDITLTIGPGVEVILRPDVSLRASGTIRIQGSDSERVRIRAMSAEIPWRTIVANGTDSALAIQHADISGGTVLFGTGSTGVIEDSFIHDFNNGSTPIAQADAARSVTVRRTHFRNYYETLWQETMMLIEDSLFEFASRTNSDALDFDTAPPGSAIRRCTFRHGSLQNTDAIDLGSGSRGVLVEDCLIYDFPSDKGISIGEDSFDIVVRNTLIRGCDTGIAVKDDCTATVTGCTIVKNNYGIRNYNKADPGAATGGGHITESYNNLLWGNLLSVSLANSSTFNADHSLISGTNWPGTGNIALEPVFVNEPAADFGLKNGSPGTLSGRDGTRIGARFPVGTEFSGSHPSFVGAEWRNGEFVMSLGVDDEREYALLGSHSVLGPWTEITNIVTSGGPAKRTVSTLQTSGLNFWQIRSRPRP